MVNRRVSYYTMEDTSGSGDANTLAEMCVAMDELHCQNQTMEDNVHNVKQHQQESNPQ